MRKGLLLLLLLISTILFSQENNKSVGRYAVGISFSPEYSKIHWTGENAGSINSIEGMTPLLGYRVTTNFYYYLNHRWDFDIGLCFADRRYRFELLIEEGSFIEPNPLLEDVESVIFIDNYFTIGIPLKATFNIMKSRFSFSVSSGFSPDVFVFGRFKRTYNYTDGTNKVKTKSSLADKTIVHFSIIAGLSIKYDISNRIGLKAEPLFRYEIFRTPQKNRLIPHIYTFGVNFSGIYSF